MLGSDMTQVQVADRLGVSQAFISGQAKILVQDKALIPIKGGRQTFYHRGPNFAKYERLSVDDTRVEEPPAPMNRLHYIRGKCEITNPDALDYSAIDWEKDWHPRAEQTYRMLVLKQYSATVIVHDKTSLIIWIHDMDDVPEDPDALDYAYNLAQQKIFDVVKHLSKECGFKLSLPTMSRKIHIAQELPELKGVKTGKILLDEEGDEYIDDSLKGRPEAEVETIEKAKQRATAYKILPDLMQRLAEYIASNNRRERKDEEVIETVLKIATDQNDRHNQLMVKLEQVIQLNNKTYESDKEDPPGYL
ncbi:MAG: hypothetical protein ACXADO_00590 [Candidatus Thorarchaeota archaeon]